MVQKVDSIWMDGRLVPWDDAQVHVLTHTLHYGLGAFEGIRAYRLDDGRSAIFRLWAHLDRLLASCKMIRVEVPFSREELGKACLEVLTANALAEAYLRPIVFVGAGAMGLFALNNPTRVAIAAWPWGAYLGEEGLQQGIRACVSSFRRLDATGFYPKGKICGQYVNSIMAKREALHNGYQEAILLDSDGYVSEASGENVFLVFGRTILTPPLCSSILGGITRDAVLTLAREMDYTIVEERMQRDMLYKADEVFMTGTAAEVTPVREVDGIPVGDGKPGPVTKALQARFFDVVRGRVDDHHEWLTVYDPQGDARL